MYGAASFSFPIGTIVTLIGREADQFISINEIAKKLETINYEIPCIIANRVPRLYKKGGQIVDLKNYLLEDLLSGQLIKVLT